VADESFEAEPERAFDGGHRPGNAQRVPVDESPPGTVAR
jgi:hypothetical protein